MQETYTDWTLVSLSPLSSTSQWLIGLLVVVAAALVIWSYRGARRAPALMLARIVGALLVLGFLIEPALQLRAVRKIRNRLAIVVDRSRSMTLATESGHNRYDNVLAVIDQSRATLEKLAQSHTIDWFDLEGPLTPVALKSPPIAERSDLLSAVERARDAGAGRPLAGIVLISDGADNAELEERGGALATQAIARLERLGAPVNTLDPTVRSSFRDVSIADVVADEFAFVHNTMEIDVVVESIGFDSMTMPVTLRRDGELLATQEVMLNDKTPARVLFKTKPDKIGGFVYSVSVPEAAGEAIKHNNMKSFVVQVIRDKIRVLQVSGRPSWDERFLRQHLKENPNVDLISFFILRSPTDDTSIPENELSLIPFPVTKLFTTELRSFDVVVFQNFDFRPHPMARYLPNIRDAVREGLGFVMLGGVQSFAGGGYGGTPVDEVLPVRMEQAGLREGHIRTALTPAGLHHPITDLSRGVGDNALLWRSLPDFSSMNLTAGLKPGATSLVVAQGADGSAAGGMPLVAVTDVDKGRSMAITTDSMWRWRFSSARDGGAAERAYHRFWSNALRWLVRDPEHSRVRVLPSKRRFELDEPVDVTVSVLGQDYQPVAGARVRLTLEHTDGVTGGSSQLDELTTDETGTARHRYTELQSGAFRATAAAHAPSGESSGDGNGVWVVEARTLELTRGAPRRDLLQAIAQHTGGRALELEESAFEDLKLVDPEVIEIDRKRNIDLWDNAWALGVGVVLFAVDWALRRRSGYL